MTGYVYRIRHRQTGKFKLGGVWPHWSAKGKAWASRSAVKLHVKLSQRTLSSFAGYTSQNDPDNWEVVPYRVVERELRSIPVAEFVR